MAQTGEGPDLATVEHLWGRRRNGKAYCVAACRACNQARGDMHCIWRFGELRRRLVDLGVWPACENPSRAVTTLLRDAVEASLPEALGSVVARAPSSFSEGCIGLCHER
jgi:hypothetical protein